MSRLDQLPPDQRAALSLLLARGKSYAEVAGLLQIPPRAVHDRAHAALVMLAPREARGLSAEQRLEVGDYMLDQQVGAGERLRTRALLASSRPAREWAHALAEELTPLAGGPLSEIPAPAAQAAAHNGAGTARGGLSSGQTSRIGGALVLLVILAGIIVAIVLSTGGGSSSKSHVAAKTHTTTRTQSTPSTSSTSTTTGPSVHQLVLRPPNPHSQSIAVVEVLSESGKRAFYIQADHIPSTHGFFYAIWLYNSPHDAEPLSKAPPVGSSHRLEGGALLPANAGRFKQMLLTRETSQHPRHPGHVVLSGPFSL